jgi:hypothetical protein
MAEWCAISERYGGVTFVAGEFFTNIRGLNFEVMHVITAELTIYLFGCMHFDSIVGSS